MKRKFLVVLFAIVAALCMAFGLAACGESTNTGNTGNGGSQTEQPGGNTGSGGTHEHSWGSWRTVTEAECEKAGVKRRSCTVCNQTEEEPIPALRHNLTDIRIKLPTCTEKGSKTGMCSVCGKTETEETPAYGHLLTEHEGVQATCTTAGTKQYWSCSRCYLNFADQDGQSRLLTIEIAALGHEWNDGVVTQPATCTAEGERYFTCNRDPNHHKTEEIQIDPTAHSYGDWVPQIDAQCEETGKLGHFQCEYCHKNFDDQHEELPDITIAQLDHEWDDGQITQPATCTAEGVKTYTCNRDPDHHKTEEIQIDPAAHEYGDWVDQKDATCTKEGELGHYQCAYCRNFFDRTYQPLQRLTIEKRPHQYGAWQEEIPTSCTAPGRKGYQECESCHLKYDREEVLIEEDDLTIAQLDHNYEFDHVVTKTCQEAGYVVKRCSMCKQQKNETISDISLSAELTKLSAPFTTGPGIYEKTYTIFASGGYGKLQFRTEIYDSATDTSPSKVLDFTQNKAFVLSYYGFITTSNNWILKAICKDEAGNMTSARFSLKVEDMFMMGSGYVNEDLTRLEQKVDEGTHNYRSVKTDPTCTEQGFTTYTCADCGRDYIGDYTDPLGHEYQNDVCMRCFKHSGLLYARSGDHYIVVDIGTCTDTKLVIAEEYEGLPVTEIGANAFKNQDGIISVKIPKTITAIGSNAFFGCHKLESVTFEDNSRLTTIGEYAFAYDKLKNIKIPNSVISIGRNAFLDCSGLTNVTIEADSHLATIGEYAFWKCSSLKSIEIPNSVTLIERNAFYECSGLTSVTIGSGVTSIGSMAFSSCSNLESVTFEKDSHLTSIGDIAFQSCAFTSIEIPDSVTSIGRSAFNLCNNLQSVTFRDPTGWQVCTSSYSTSGSDLEESHLQDKNIAAVYLVKTYADYYWKKKA